MIWVVCPQCLSACEGVVGDLCSECDVPQVATPLYHETRVVSSGYLYTAEERALLKEFGV